MKRPTNVKELRDDLLEAYAMLKADPKRHPQVKTLSETAGKILGSLKIELEYAAIRGEQPEIPFISEGLSVSKNIKSLASNNVREIQGK